MIRVIKKIELPSLVLYIIFAQPLKTDAFLTKVFHHYRNLKARNVDMGAQAPHNYDC